MKRIVCKYCGVEHDCAGRMSNHERAKLAAVARAAKAAKVQQIRANQWGEAVGKDPLFKR